MMSNGVVAVYLLCNSCVVAMFFLYMVTLFICSCNKLVVQIVCSYNVFAV